jgi:S-formylglutathione hydrolase FrmB
MSRNVRWIWIALFASGLAQAQGVLIHDTLFSAALDQWRRADVYLPDGYSGGSAHYPVIYFLHGLNSTPDDYAMIADVLDGLIGGHLMEPTIAVLPDGSCPPYGGSLYTNSDLYGAFEDYIAEDVVQYVDANYRTLSMRSRRAIMGHSMGGYGAMKMAFKHPGEYCGVVSLSGFVDVVPFDFWQAEVLSENGGHGPYYPQNGFFTYGCYTAAGAFTPNLSNPPYYVDFPLDLQGNVVESVFDEWLLQMPGHLATLDSAVHSLAIRFDCGYQDELGFYPMNEHFSATLNSLGIAHQFEGFVGDHTSQLLLRGTLGLMYLDSVMRTLSGVEPLSPALPMEISLLQNYPNPFNAATWIEFHLPQAAVVDLHVYDLLGREVANLSRGYLAAGVQQVSFSSNGLSSGAYFYRLRCGSQSLVRRMTLLK